ncbi:breast carcinoma-amplified sequence 1 [Festucalex cinctus]
MGNEHSKNKDQSKINQCDKNGVPNGLAVNITSSGLDIDAKSLTPNQQNGKAALNSTAESDYVVVQSDSQHVETVVVPEKSSATSQTEEAEKHEEKLQLFDKIFKKKEEPEAPVDVKSVAEEEVRQNIARDASLPAPDTQLETANQKPEALTEPDSGTPDQTDHANSPAAEAETNPEESPVMNFFKNLMTPTKTSKKETPEVPKDQQQREKQPEPTTTVAQVSDPPAASKGMLIPPPPPPPELPKVDTKVEPSGKSAKPTTSKEKTKAVAKSTESPKGKSTKDVLSKFFRSKKVDPSKAGTLEATAKPDPPPPVHEDKKNPSKSSFLTFFKPKASEPKKASPSPVKAADAPPTAVKPKEEPKAAAKSCEVVGDDKAASVAPKAGDNVANAGRKSEKRNSIQLFLKHLGQKRHSTDAGVQTEPVTVAPAAK